MIKNFIVPPLIVAIYLVAVNWPGMYQKPDLIMLPILTEAIAFGIALLIAVPTHWLLITPSCYLLVKLTGSRFGGVVLATIYASVIPAVLAILDWPTFSWTGTLSSTHITQVIIPLLFLCLYGYRLIYNHLNSDKDDSLSPWIAPAVSRVIFIGIFFVIAGFIVTVSLFDQAPLTRPFEAKQQERPVKGQALLEAHQHVINTLLDKRGGLMRGNQLSALRLLENHYNWERGVEKQILAFAVFLEHTNFFFENPVKSTRRRPQVAFLLETAEELKQASIKARQASLSKNPSEAEKLYREALGLIEQMKSRIVADDGNVKGQRYLGRWLGEASTNIERTAMDVRMHQGNIDQALNPGKYSSRDPAVLAIQALWKENDALYEVYGSAWALSIYLRAVAMEYRGALENANTMSLLQDLIASLEQCAPNKWTSVLLNSSGIVEIQQEMHRINIQLNSAMGDLYRLNESLPWE